MLLNFWIKTHGKGCFCHCKNASADLRIWQFTLQLHLMDGKQPTSRMELLGLTVLMPLNRINVFFQLTSTSNLWAFISMARICRSYLSSLLVFAHHFFDWKQPAAVFYRRLSRPQQLTVVVFCLRCIYFWAHTGCLQLRLRSDEGHPPTEIFALAYTMHTPLQAPCARHACSTFA